MSKHNSTSSKDVQIYTPEAVRAGVYANTTSVAVTNNEVVINFINLNQQDTPPGTVVSRVIITRHHADGLVKLLSDAISTANEKVGDISAEPLLSSLTQDEAGTRINVVFTPHLAYLQQYQLDLIQSGADPVFAKILVERMFGSGEYESFDS